MCLSVAVDNDVPFVAAYAWRSVLQQRPRQYAIVAHRLAHRLETMACSHS